MLKGNAIVGQSGGPTAVINASLAGVIETAVSSRTSTGSSACGSGSRAC